MTSTQLRTVEATRYVQPLREGGSLPGLVEADDEGMYVVKFRGAGQGSGALVAELIVGELARRGGLPVPELVFIDVDPTLGRSDPDGEVQALIQASGGINVGCDFLPGALPFDGALIAEVDPHLASQVVWLDAFVTNIDRTARNTNLLLWHRRLHLIDHGAALYVMHAWDGYEARVLTPFSPIRDHVLLPIATQMAVVDEWWRTRMSPADLTDILEIVPEAWWPLGRRWQSPADAKQAMWHFLSSRLAASHVFVAEVERARATLV